MPKLGTVDYSPIANALRGRGAAGQANFSEQMRDLQDKEQTRQSVVGAIQGAMSVAGDIYGLMEKAKDQKSKTDTINHDIEFNNELMESISDGTTHREDGADGKVNYVLSPKLQAMQKAYFEYIDKAYKGFGRVKQNMKNQAQDMMASGSKYIDSMFLKKDLEEAEAAFQTSLPMAVDQAVKAGNPSIIFDTIYANGTLSERAKASEWSKWQKEYGFQSAKKNVVQSASESLSGAMEQIDGTSFNDDEKARLRSVAYGIDKEMVGSEKGSIDKVIAGAVETGDPMGAAVEKQLAGISQERRQEVRQYVDQKRDSAMWEQYRGKMNAPGANPAALYDRIKYDRKGMKGYTGHYEGAEIERTKELNDLAGILGLEKQQLEAKDADKLDVEISGLVTQFETGVNNAQVTIAALKGSIYDLSPTKANAAIGKVLSYKNAAFSEFYKNMASYSTKIAKEYKLDSGEALQLDSILSTTVYQAYMDNPNMNENDYAKLATELTTAMVGKGAKKFTQLAKNGWFTKTPDGVGELVYELENNPTVAKSAVYTEAVFDKNTPVQTRIVPFMSEKLNQMLDVGRTELAAVLGTNHENVNAAFQEEGLYDSSAFPVFKVRDGSEVRTIYVTAPKKKLEFYEIIGGQRVFLKPKDTQKAALQAESIRDMNLDGTPAAGKPETPSEQNARLIREGAPF